MVILGLAVLVALLALSPPGLGHLVQVALQLGVLAAKIRSDS